MGKSIMIAILLQIGGKTLALIVLSCEMAIYLLYKVIRRDFRYWMALPQGTSLFISLMFRISYKILADFTGMLHLRHPYEVGRAYVASHENENEERSDDLLHAPRSSR